mmetsp:Transcript_8624/g.13115  ORF Transcript_8624/g.13115 Transcript_8624/m.13115 type:complete len:445 (+) Transcript_8624:97-1431(+)
MLLLLIVIVVLLGVFFWLQTSTPKTVVVQAQPPQLDMPTQRFNNDLYQTKNHHYLNDLHGQLGNVFRLIDVPHSDKIVYVRSQPLVRKVLSSMHWRKCDWPLDGEIAQVSNLVQPMFQHTFFELDGPLWKQRRRLLNQFFQISASQLPKTKSLIDRELALYTCIDNKRRFTLNLHESFHEIIQTLMFHIGFGEQFSFRDSRLFTLHCKLIQMLQESGKHAKLTPEAIAVIDDIAAEYGKLVETMDTNVPCMASKMANDGIDQKEIVETIFNLVVAGAESPASLFADMFFHIANDGTLQTQLRDRLSDDRFLSQVVEESCRKFAPATLIHRQAVCDTQLGPYTLTAGSVVGICLYAYHYNPELYENPAVFDAQRVGTARQLAFSSGRFGCPGAGMTKVLGKYLIQCLLSRYKLAPSVLETKKARILKFVTWDQKNLFVDCEEIFS